MWRTNSSSGVWRRVEVEGGYLAAPVNSKKITSRKKSVLVKKFRFIRNSRPPAPFGAYCDFRAAAGYYDVTTRAKTSGDYRWLCILPLAGAGTIISSWIDPHVMTKM